MIAVGGGLPCYKDNMEWLNQHGTTIYLQRPPKELFQRLRKGKENRPLIENLSDETLYSYIEKKLEEREPFYQQAQITLNRNQQTLSFLMETLSKIEN